MAQGTQRRLTTIVAADIAGFSRLVGADEEATLAAQRGHRVELVEPLLAAHNGRIANTAGDSFLLEFPSAVEAIRCSISVQEGMAERNRDVPAERRIEFRIGINVGDVVADGEDLLGDGVNIAARLENLCEPGSVILSDDAYRQIRDRLDVVWEDGCECEVKNIACPVQVWRWLPARLMVEEAVQPGDDDGPVPRGERPSIAVLPFGNMSGDPEQEYFSDGITEDLITDLSKFSWFTVIARSSSFAYKGQSTDLRTVAKELGVRYVLEGSVRKSGARVRITAQLVDARDGGHIWAERYDRKLHDIFDLQDEMTQAISAAIWPEMEKSEIRRTLGKRPENFNAWDYVVRARANIVTLSRKSMIEVRQLAGKALQIQPDYGDALSIIALSHTLSAMSGWSANMKESTEVAIELTQRALQENPDNTFALNARGYGEAILGQYDQAVASLRQCVALNPNESLNRHALAMVLIFRGDYDAAVKQAEMSRELSPRAVSVVYAFYVMALAYYTAGRVSDTLDWCIRTEQEFLSFPITHLKAVALVECGQVEDAKQAIRNLLAVAPKATTKIVQSILPAKDADLIARYTASLRAAGLPD